MRVLWGMLAVVIAAGLVAGFYLLKPVEGQARDLSLRPDAESGSYLIRIGGCISCHTDSANGRALLSGGPALPTPFGTFYAPNITSHPEAGIGRWTIEMFSKAMSDGEGPQGHLYPAFPYEHYTMMSDQEIVDLFAALKQVPPVATRPPNHDVPFPFNVRMAMSGWKNLYFSPGRYRPDPARSATWNRGRYLVVGPAHCVACHSPRDQLGGLQWNQMLTGNPEGGTGGRAPAITAAALREKGYDVEILMQTLKDGFTPNMDVLGGSMREVIAEGTAHWTDEDLRAVAEYLLTR
jgi:mono/diheme cytochrome c family protein